MSLNDMAPAIGGLTFAAGMYLYALHIRNKALRDSRRDRERSTPAE